MSLYNKLRNIYPSLTSEDFALNGKISLQNDSDGRGDYIKAWNHPTLSCPSEEQLASASDIWPPPPQLSEAKKLAVDNTKREAYNLLLETDWMFIRSMEDQAQSVDPDIVNYRANIRKTQNDYEALINATTSKEDLDNLLNSRPIAWPASPIASN